MVERDTQIRGFDPRLLHDLFNASPIGIVVEDLEGQPLFVNPAFCAFLGFSEGELCNKHCVDFSPPEDAERDWALFQQLRAGSIDHYQLEKRYFRQDGSLVWGSLSISLFNVRPSPLILAMVEDITEKKTAEEARYRYAAIVESSDDAIASGTLEGTIVSWNRGAERIYGYTEAEAIGMPITVLVPPELPDEENKILETLRAGSRIEHFETVRVTKSGKRINISLSISPIKDSSGKTVGCCGIARDITERKRYEENARKSEERFRLAAHAGRMFAYEWDAATDLITRSSESAHILGINETEPITGQEVLAKVHPDDRERLKDAVAALSPEKPYLHLSYRMIRPDNTAIWVERSSRAHFDGRGTLLRIIGMVADITDRKRAEEAVLEMNRALEAQASLLRSREELLRVFVKNVPVAVAMLDRDMRYLQVSDRWRTDYLPGRAEILGRSHYEIFPDMPERWKEVHRRALQGETLRADEDRWDGQDGPRWARWEVRPWMTAQSDVGGILILAEDITHRKKMEEELSDMSRKMIESQERERARIARELHDDISQRLALLAVELEQLRQSPSEAESRMQKLREETSEISKDVQALAHDLHSSQLEYLGALAGMKTWCREFGKRRGMQIDFSHDGGNALPREIGLCLFRVVQEALQNAAKHSGVKRIDVQLREDSGEIHLIVCDSGKGFEVEVALQGKGLGLTSMRERVRLINGTIAIDSKPLGGTVIHVRVPLASAQRSELAG
jgi:PAS domain S-box-containing protein